MQGFANNRVDVNPERKEASWMSLPWIVLTLLVIFTLEKLHMEQLRPVVWIHKSNIGDWVKDDVAGKERGF